MSTIRWDSLMKYSLPWFRRKYLSCNCKVNYVKWEMEMHIYKGTRFLQQHRRRWTCCHIGAPSCQPRLGLEGNEGPETRCDEESEGDCGIGSLLLALRCKSREQWEEPKEAFQMSPIKMPDGRGQEIKYVLNHFSVRNSTANLRTLYAVRVSQNHAFMSGQQWMMG